MDRLDPETPDDAARRPDAGGSAQAAATDQVEPGGDFAVDSDIAGDLPITPAELDALVRLLGPELDLLLG